jgi:membrane protease YdiL (CAAX protease family)
MNRGKELLVFLGLTFALTYIIQYIGLSKGELLNGGYSGSLTPEIRVALQFAMYIPALVAIVMNRFIQQKDIYKGKAKWIINYYLILSVEIAVAFILVTILGVHNSNPFLLRVLNILTSLTGIIGTILLISLNSKEEWRSDLERAKLHIGDIKLYLIYPSILVGFFTFGAYIDLYLGLGTDPHIDSNILFIGAINALLLSPILGLTTGVFGEEYGWRIYLQDLLTQRFGKLRGVVILGIIWGLWHAPVVLAGWTYPGYGFMGVVIFTVMATLIGAFLSYSTFVSGTVWLSAYLHAVNNAYGNYSINLVNFYDPVNNFRFGIYGIPFLVILVSIVIFGNRRLWGLK